MNVGAAPIKIAVAARMQQPGTDAIQHDADSRHHHDGPTCHRRRRREPTRRLPSDGTARQQQQHGIDQRRQH